jgi:hypothetical protein
MRCERNDVSFFKNKNRNPKNLFSKRFEAPSFFDFSSAADEIKKREFFKKERSETKKITDIFSSELKTISVN